MLKNNLKIREDEDAKRCKKLLEFEEIPIIDIEPLKIDNIILPDWIDSKNVDFIRKYFNFCLIKNKRHLETCDCLYNIYNKYRIIESNRLKRELLEGEIINNTDIKRAILNIENKIYYKLLKECIDNKYVCPYELEVIYDILNRFGNKYDFKDSNVFSIVRDVIINSLTVHRLSLDADVEGLVEKHYDKFNNKHLVLNPVIEERRRLGDSIISAIEKLNKIIEGTKIKIDIDNTKVFRREDMYGDALNEPETHQD